MYTCVVLFHFPQIEIFGEIRRSASKWSIRASNLESRAKVRLTQVN